MLAYAGLACIEVVLISVLAMYAGLDSIVEIAKVFIETEFSMPVGEAFNGISESAFTGISSLPVLLALFFMKTMAVSVIVKKAKIMHIIAATTPPITATGTVDVTAVLSTMEKDTEGIE